MCEAVAYGLGLGLAEQRSQVGAEAARRGWELDLVVDDGYSANDLRRPGIAAALDDLAACRAELFDAEQRAARAEGTVTAAERRGWWRR
ncbi:MAG: hypothetical protein M3P96_02255 [Actinomycetota bacterium]|nr:hypothetical protein [Actinomycetota bacterium]